MSTCGKHWWRGTDARTSHRDIAPNGTLAAQTAPSERAKSRRIGGTPLGLASPGSGARLGLLSRFGNGEFGFYLIIRVNPFPLPDSACLSSAGVTTHEHDAALDRTWSVNFPYSATVICMLWFSRVKRYSMGVSTIVYRRWFCRFEL